VSDPYLIALVGLPVVAFVTAWRLRLFVHPNVAAWREITALHGLDGPGRVMQELSRRSGTLQRLLGRTPMPVALRLAGRPGTPLGYVLTVAARVAGVAAAVLVVDAVTEAVLGTRYVAPWLIGLAGVGMILHGGIDLRRQVRSRHRTIERQTTALLGPLAMEADGRVERMESLRRLSELLEDHTLRRFLAADPMSPQSYLAMVTEPPDGTAELFSAIGRAYGLDVFSTLADAELQTHGGTQRRDAFGYLARTRQERLQHEHRVRADRSLTRAYLPLALLVVNLLVAVLVPFAVGVLEALRG
jgi:hypothetical protein